MLTKKTLVLLLTLVVCVTLPAGAAGGQRPTNTQGFPDISGEWTEGTNHVRIVQSGSNVTATCTYGSVSWRMEGTIARDGVCTGRLVHTAGVSPSANGYTQDRRLTLSADGRVLEGLAALSGGGSQPLTWRRTSPLPPVTPAPPVANPPAPPSAGSGTSAGGYPDISGDWLEGTNQVRISQSGSNITATCTYGNVSWRMEGTIARNGVLTGRLTHTAGVSSSANGYTQDRQLTLSADGGILDGKATFTGDGGGQPVTWRRTSPPPLAASLTGPWVHSADAATSTPDSKVIVVQDGSAITLTTSYRSDATGGSWVTLICSGPLTNGEVRLRCNWAPGGNPLGLAGNELLVMRVSPDGQHMDGALQSATGSQESHYSRLR